MAGLLLPAILKWVQHRGGYAFPQRNQELIKKVEEYRSDEAFDVFLKLQVLCALKVR